MKILNFGSLNLDYVYRVDHIVTPGETLTSDSLSVFPGGKGLNQSVALARAGADVMHAGLVGADGGMLCEVLKENGVDTRYVRTVEERTGNAIIQVSADGENSIVLYGGANRAQTSSYIDEVLSQFGAGDCLLMQNEINLPEELIERASNRGMRIFLNPSPFDEKIAKCDLGKISLFLINEVEGRQITGEEKADDILAAMKEKYPQAEVLLTLGSRGSRFLSGNDIASCGICRVKAVDTTAAGDTFTGYFLQEYLGRGRTAEEAMETAARASAIAVSRSGAVPSIPWMSEVEALAEKMKPEA